MDTTGLIQKSSRQERAVVNRKLLLLIVMIGFSFCLSFADSFTDAIQDLAVQTACIGTYSATQAGGGWDDDPYDYYTPNMMAERFKKMSGNMTRTTTFYGVCFDYADFAWQDVEKYKTWYTEQGMYERQFWIAGVHENPNIIELSHPGTKNDHTRMQNGVPIKTYNNSNRNVKTHSGATKHAWLWIQRADGVWFWIDPTWTDNTGYVVYGYVTDGKEIQCRPDKGYCLKYPPELDNFPLPPAMGVKKAPSKTANSTNREEIINDAAPEYLTDLIIDTARKTFVDVNYDGMDSYIGLIASCNIPFNSMKNKSISTDIMSFGLDVPVETEVGALILGFNYLRNFKDDKQLQAGLLIFDFNKRFFNHLSGFLGGGAGFGFYPPKSAQGNAVPTLEMAYKVNTGFLFNISHFITKVEISYDNVIGFSAGAGVGISFVRIKGNKR